MQNQIVVYDDLQDLDDASILAAMQQIKNVSLAYEALRVLIGDDIKALPVALDKSWLYWCTVNRIGNNLYYGTCITKFHSANAGDVINIEARLAPKMRNSVVKAVTRILKESPSIINDQAERNFRAYSRGSAPENAYEWLRECQKYLKIGMAK